MATTRSDILCPQPDTPTSTAYLSKKLAWPVASPTDGRDEKKINITMSDDHLIAAYYDYINKTLSPGTSLSTGDFSLSHSCFSPTSASIQALSFGDQKDTMSDISPIVPSIEYGHDNDSVALYNRRYLQKMLGSGYGDDSSESDTEEEDTSPPFIDIQSNGRQSFHVVNDESDNQHHLFRGPLPSRSIAARKPTNVAFLAVKIFSEEKEKDKRLVKDRKKEAVERAREVFKCAMVGALAGTSFSCIITFTIAELIALGVYRDAVCAFNYSAGEEYTCKTVSCNNGMVNLRCTSDIENYGALLRKGTKAGRQAHSDWWDYSGEALMMFAMSGGFLVGSVVGGIYGFFKRIPTTRELAIEAELERRHVKEFPYYYYLEPFPPIIEDGLEKCTKLIAGAPKLFQKMKCPGLTKTVSYLQSICFRKR